MSPKIGTFASTINLLPSALIPFTVIAPSRPVISSLSFNILANPSSVLLTDILLTKSFLSDNGFSHCAVSVTSVETTEPPLKSSDEPKFVTSF